MITTLATAAGLSPVVTVAATLCALMLAAAFLLTLWRIARGPSLPDRVVGLDLVALLAVCVIGLLTLVHREASFLDAALALALVAFLGTIAFARYAEQRGRP
ncbi:monovalent cation/H+ antiporter complex subunit F [Caenispirillum bisanense]|uniref:Multisubunit sodium/proton antiporter, MrpF subunit n=1 Tax=Caenispirillum bisanense TaxID=414052 RepID=A0A286G103_9PROT|nr:monovalent cation/H+ antiporter complex subunit F [Caenispirillum bisanense]SOD89221.1 multisubunit sodium/proton antiporter, MrpF subunit [Caenispirillum bisanense]